MSNLAWLKRVAIHAVQNYLQFLEQNNKGALCITRCHKMVLGSEEGDLYKIDGTLRNF